MNLEKDDLCWAVRRLPKKLKEVMKTATYPIMVGGGYLRASVSGEEVKDVDVFVSTMENAISLKNALLVGEGDIVVHESVNAITLFGFGLPIQIITRWVFPDMAAVSDSFDFTVCCAVIQCFPDIGEWDSYIDPRFYSDLAAKRLHYRSPSRNEDVGGSALRVLKYYSRGYRMCPESFAQVIARLVSGVDHDVRATGSEQDLAFVISGLLREVDPLVDPLSLGKDGRIAQKEGTNA